MQVFSFTACFLCHGTSLLFNRALPVSSEDMRQVFVFRESRNWTLNFMSAISRAPPPLRVIKQDQHNRINKKDFNLNYMLIDMYTLHNVQGHSERHGGKNLVQHCKSLCTSFHFRSTLMFLLYMLGTRLRHF